jgi:hypothetical protein
MNEQQRQDHVERVRRDGYTIVENAIEDSLISSLDEALVRLERNLMPGPP